MGKVVRVVAVVALAVAVAYFAPQLAPLFLSATATAAATAAVTAAVAAVLTVAGTLALNAILPPPKAKQGAPQMTRVSVGNSAILYGERRPVSTQIIFYHPRKVGKDHFRYFALAAAGHRCKGVKDWMLNDEVVTVGVGGLVTSGAYANNAWLWFARGTEDQEAHPTFVAECGGKWTAEHRGRGVAMIYAKFKMTDDVVQAGMPLIAPVIEGKDDILDPRTGAAGYTRLATPIIYDWLAMPREEGGFGASADEMPDDALLSAWTNICDEDVAVGGGATEKRYLLDASFLTGSAPSEVRQTFQTCCAGTYTYSGGKFLLRPGYWNPPSVTLSEDDLAGPIMVPLLADPQEIATEVSGTFIDPAANYQPQPIPVRGTPDADIRQLDVDLAHITSTYRGQRILEIMKRRAACEKKVTWPMNIAGLATQAMDTVQLDTERYGLSNYAWVVDGWGMDQSFGVGLKLREENEDIYSDDIGYAAAVTPPALEQGEVIASPADLSAVQLLIQNSSNADVDITSADTSGTASITIANHSRVYADKTVAVTGATLPGLTNATTYYLAYDDPDRAGGAVTYIATQVYADAFLSAAHPARHFVGSIVTATAGGGATGGGGSTPPGSGGRRPNELSNA